MARCTGQLAGALLAGWSSHLVVPGPACQMLALHLFSAAAAAAVWLRGRGLLEPGAPDNLAAAEHTQLLGGQAQDLSQGPRPCTLCDVCSLE